jgi:basic membrane protein A
MKNRLWVFLTFMVVFAMMLVACGGGDATEEVTEPTYKAVVIMPNPLGDRSFIDSSARGIEQANNELDVSTKPQCAAPSKKGTISCSVWQWTPN